MTILEAIHTYYRITCGICHSYFDLSAANYTKFEVARILIELGWTIAHDTTLCPSCSKDWEEESKDG